MRTQKLIFAQILSAIIFSSPPGHAAAAQASKTPVDPGFDLFLLVRTWSPTFCRQLSAEHSRCTANAVQAFTIHGLWPEYSTGGWPQFCSHGDTSAVTDEHSESESESDSDSDSDSEEDEDLIGDDADVARMAETRKSNARFPVQATVNKYSSSDEEEEDEEDDFGVESRFKSKHLYDGKEPNTWGRSNTKDRHAQSGGGDDESERGQGGVLERMARMRPFQAIFKGWWGQQQQRNNDDDSDDQGCHKKRRGQLEAEGVAKGVAGDEQACEWPSFHGTDVAFWNHEWSKHGTCAAPLLGNRTKFMGTVMALHDKYDINAVFEAAGIVPRMRSAGLQSFPSRVATDAVQAAWGVAPRLACYRGNLAELWLCLNTTLDLVDCPPKVGPAAPCRDVFWMPPGAQVSRECRPYFPPQNHFKVATWLIQTAAGVAIAAAAASAFTAGRRLAAGAAEDRYMPLPLST